MAPTKNNGLADADSTAMVFAANGGKVSPDKVAKRKEPFRYRWQKKKDGRFGYQDALVNSENADNAKEKKAVRTPKSEAADDESDNDAGHYYNGGKSLPGPAPDAEETDMEFKEEGSDDDYDGASKKPISGKKKQKNLQKYVQKAKKPNPNGRVVGRKLVMWHRPRMVEKLMLHLQYECHRAGLKLPWDKAVDRLSTGSSGASALQHLNKLRDILITEGHMVPPLLGKYTIPQDPTVRGYTRDMNAEKPTDTRVVRWGEHIEDRKENLEVEGVIRGSGNYRRGLLKGLENIQRATGERRNRLPVELHDSRTESNGAAGTTKKAIKRRASVISSRSQSVDPAEMDSDEEYDPSSAKKKGKYGLRKVAKSAKKYKVEENSDVDAEDQTDDEADQPVRQAVTYAMSTPQAKRLKEETRDNGHGLITPPSTKPVILNLRPEVLKRFPSGTGMKNEEGPGFAVENSGDEIDQAVTDYGNSKANGKYGVAPIPQTPTHPLAQQMARATGYQGIGVHGLKTQYDDAIRRGVDPKINGLDYKKKGPAVNSQALVSGEGRVSSAYKLSAQPAYPAASTLRNSTSPLAGSSAGAFPVFSSRVNSNTVNPSMTFGEYMAGLQDQDSVGAFFGNGQQMMVDPFCSANTQYTTGSDIFQTGANNSTTGNLGYGNNDARAGFSLGVNYGRNGSSSVRTPAVASPAIGFELSANNAATQQSFESENTGDNLSEAHSSPARYADYLPEDGDNKENREWFDEGYAY